MARPMSRPYVVAEEKTDYAHQAYMILKFGFTVAPVIAGLDKFFNLLVDWTRYLTPLVPVRQAHSDRKVLVEERMSAVRRRR